MGSAWICLDCGNIFIWVRQGIETRPECCPRCGSKNIDGLEG